MGRDHEIVDGGSVHGGRSRLPGWAGPCLVAAALLTACGSSSPDTSALVDTASTSLSESTTTTVRESTTTSEATASTSQPESTTTTVESHDSPTVVDATFSLNGDDPTTFPEGWSIGFISLSSTISDVESVFGLPDRVEEEGYGDVRSWDLPGGGRLEIGGVPGLPDAIGYVALEIPEGSPVRAGLDGGVVFGTAQLDDLTAAWGDPIACADIGKSDCDVLYSRCIGVGDAPGALLVMVTADPADSLGEKHVRRVMLGENQSPQMWESCAALGLSSDGLGVADLGQAEAEAVPTLLMVLGPTSADERFDWTAEEGPVGIHYGYPAAYRLRSMAWSDLGVWVVFSDGVEWPDGRQGSVLISWAYHPPIDTPLVLWTTDRLTVGSPAVDLVAAHGDALMTAAPDEYTGWSAAIPSSYPAARPLIAGLSFGLSDDPSLPGSVIEGISAGAGQAP